MEEKKKNISVNWLSDRFDDDYCNMYKDIANDLIAINLSSLNYKEINSAFNIEVNRKITFNNSLIKTALGNNSAFSFGASIAALSNNIAYPFVIPPDIIRYINEEIDTTEKFKKYVDTFPSNTELYDIGKRLFDDFIGEGYPPQAAYSLCGAAFVECAWNPNVYNKAEVLKKKGTAKAAGGWSGTGEGLFGLTCWYQKEKIITSLSLNTIPVECYRYANGKIHKEQPKIWRTITSNEAKYNSGPDKTTLLFQCTEAIWVKILKEYLAKQNAHSTDEKKPLDYILYDGVPKNSEDEEDDDHKLLYATYLFKAGYDNKGTTKENVKARADAYKRTHEKIFKADNPNFTSVNGFIKQLLIASLLAQYIETNDIAKLTLDGIVNVNNDYIRGKAASGEFSGGLFEAETVDLSKYDKVDENDYTVDGSWWDCVKKMGKWYETNVHTYQGTRAKPRTGRKTYKCPLINGNVEDDCSAFVKACLYFFGLKDIGKMHIATATMQPGSAFDKLLRNNGFKCIPYSFDALQPGDIICGGPATHTEIYAGNRKSYSWGNVHDGTDKFQGMPCGFAKSIKYKHIWRYVGGGDNVKEQKESPKLSSFGFLTGNDKYKLWG